MGSQPVVRRCQGVDCGGLSGGPWASGEISFKCPVIKTNMFSCYSGKRPRPFYLFRVTTLVGFHSVVCRIIARVQQTQLLPIADLGHQTNTVSSDSTVVGVSNLLSLTCTSASVTSPWCGHTVTASLSPPSAGALPPSFAITWLPICGHGHPENTCFTAVICVGHAASCVCCTPSPKTRDEFWLNKIDAEGRNPRQLWQSINALMYRGRVPPFDAIGATQSISLLMRSWTVYIHWLLTHHRRRSRLLCRAASCSNSARTDPFSSVHSGPAHTDWDLQPASTRVCPRHADVWLLLTCRCPSASFSSIQTVASRWHWLH